MHRAYFRNCDKGSNFMKRKFLLLLSLVFILSAFSGCGKDETDTKYEYSENVIYAEEDTSIKLLNLTESENEMKLNFSIENFETEDVKVTVYNPERKDITDNLECSFDEENKTVSIKGDISQVDIAELDLNYKTNLMLKELKNNKFKYLLTSFEEDKGCTYVGDVEEFKTEEEENNETEIREETADLPVRSGMTDEEIYNLLEGKWIADEGDFVLEFTRNIPGDIFHVTALGESEFDSDVTYVDETMSESGEHRIRFVTSGAEYASCREVLLSDTGTRMSYISGVRKNDDGVFEDVYISLKRN